MEAFDHAWSLLKAAGRMSPVGGSKESQPVGRYLDRTKGGPPMEQWRSPAEWEPKSGGINPREMLEEAEPPTGFQPSDYQQEDPGMGEFLDMDSTRLQEEMMRDFESRAGGPPVSSGLGNIPIEQRVEHARGYVPEGDYSQKKPLWAQGFSPHYKGGGPGSAGGGIGQELDSSVYSGWKGFDPKMAPLSQEIYQQR